MPNVITYYILVHAQWSNLTGDVRANLYAGLEAKGYGKPKIPHHTSDARTISTTWQSKVNAENAESVLQRVRRDFLDVTTSATRSVTSPTHTLKIAVQVGLQVPLIDQNVVEKKQGA